MFVRDFIHVEQPFETVAPRFVADARWLHALSDDDRMHFETGPVRVRLDSLVVPLSMSAVGPSGTAESGPAGALPPLEADLEVSPLGPDRSQLTLSATYRRPGASGPEAQLAQRAAEAGVRSFLQALAALLNRAP
jgi:hypothetical protein